MESPGREYRDSRVSWVEYSAREGAGPPSPREAAPLFLTTLGTKGKLRPIQRETFPDPVL